MDSNDAAKAIILGETWDVLDFGGLEKSLAAKITDDLLQELLQCINAKTKLKKLKLAGCVNVTGVGLNHLCRSIILEQIDFGPGARTRNPRVRPKTSLGE